MRILTILLAVCWLAACDSPPEFVITAIGTTDIHGALVNESNGGSLITISGYVAAVRAARQKDGGGVLLIDAGDMWQGTLESNLTEGASMVAAYNSMAFDVAALGNHEFDFGPVGPLPIPESDTDDPLGALKQRAAEANFPFLAGNLIDLTTGEPLAWPNIQPSVLIETRGVKIGIVGVMTARALTTTVAANTVGLAIAPLAETIERESKVLREAGATIIIVSAHAGGKCTDFDDPTDLSSCNKNSEIFRVAEELPEGLVDHIFAGHTHEGVAHIVNGISISQSYSRARAFSRVDLVVNRETGELIRRDIFPPTRTESVTSYEGQKVVPNETIAAIATKATALATDLRHKRIGIFLETPFELTSSPESPLGNLYTDALLASADVDIAMHRTNTSIRADLPAGELTYGSLYEMSPFDNQLTVIELSGAELRQVITEQAPQDRFRVGISGMHVHVACTDREMTIKMRLTNGREISDADSIKIAVANYLALGGDGVFTSVMPEGGYALQLDAPLVRDAIINWLQQLGGSISENNFSSNDNPKWNMPDDMDRECRSDR
jgi:2',3'-cyclic-nucleotide 2'-phosphodiesterase (5'-nucleotidase family)